MLTLLSYAYKYPEKESYPTKSYLLGMTLALFFLFIAMDKDAGKQVNK